MDTLKGLKTFPKKELFSNSMTKERFYNSITKIKLAIKCDLMTNDGNILIPFDFALPQEWLNSFSKEAENFTYDEIRSTTFMVYPPSTSFGLLFSACTEINDLINGK